MQVITDSGLNINYVLLQPFKVQYNSPTECTRLYVISIQDNLLDSATFQYRLADDIGNVYAIDTVTISNEDYVAWNGNDSSYPFSFCASQLNLSLISN